MKKVRPIISILLIFVLIVSLIPYSFFNEVKAASNKIPFYNGSNLLTIYDLMGNEETKFLRVDDSAGVTVLGQYRYVTLYNGSYGGTSTRSSLNESFTANHNFNNTGKDGNGNPTNRKDIRSAYPDHKYYHMVPNGIRDTARNIIEKEDISESDWKNVYGGNPKHVEDNIPIYTPLDSNGKQHGQFYYIGDIAKLTGGHAENTSNDFTSVNPTRLRFLVTAWTDINSFKVNKTNFNVDEEVKFSFDGWEYVYGNNEYSYEITILKDGKPYTDGIKVDGTSTKGAKSTISPEQDEGHTGAFNVKDVTGFKATEKGTYEAKLTVWDSVERYDTKTIAFTVTNPNEPSLVVLPPSQSVDVGETAQYQAIYKNENGQEIDVTTQADWSTVDITIGQSIGQGKVTGLKKGNTTVKAEYSKLTGEGLLYVDQEAKEPEPIKTNEPPTVEIVAPDEVELGEKFCAKANAYDSDGYIELYDWYGFTGEINGNDEGAFTSSSQCGLYYKDIEEDELWVQVTDNDGSSADDTHDIKVVYPKPNANFSIEGYPIENRAMRLTPDKPYKKSVEIVNAISIVKNIWKFEAIDEKNRSSIILIEDDLNNSNYEEVIEVLFRKAGEYKVTRYIENKAGLSDTETKSVLITEDMLPTSRIETSEKVYLNENGKQKVTFYSKSYSLDDVIGTRIFEIYQDSDNDGSFEDETATIKKSNADEFEYEVTAIGKYFVRVTDIENFNEPTYESHVNLTDDISTTHRKYSQATTTFEVDNMAPVVSLSAKVQPDVEVVFNTGDIVENGKYTKSKLQSQINSNLLPSLVAENINADIRIDEPQLYETSNLNLFKHDRTGKYYLIDYFEAKIKQTNLKDYNIEQIAQTTDGDFIFTTNSGWDYDRSPTFFEEFPIYFYDVSEGTVRKMVDDGSYILSLASLTKTGLLNFDKLTSNRSGQTISKINMELNVTEENNLLVTYRVGHYQYGDPDEAVEMYFVKYSLNGSILDYGKITDLNNDWDYSVDYVTENYLILAREGDDTGGIEDQLQIYKLDELLDKNISTNPFSDNMGNPVFQDDYAMIGEPLLKSDRLTFIAYDGLTINQNDYNDFFDSLYYIEILNNGQVISTKIAEENDDAYFADIGYMYDWENAFLLRNSNLVFTRVYDDHFLDVDFTYEELHQPLKINLKTLVKEDRRDIVAPNFFFSNGTYGALSGGGGRATVGSSRYTLIPDTVTYYSDETYLKIAQKSLVMEEVQASDTFTYRSDGKTYSVTVDGANKLYGSSVILTKPIVKDYKKTLADTLADTEWKSDTSTKFYVTLSDKNISDLPTENKEVASLLDQDDINYISIDTTSTKPLAQQVMEAIEQKSMQVTTTYTDTNIKTAMNKIANFIVGVVFPQEDTKTQIHISVDDSQYSLAAIQTAVTNILEKDFADVGFEVDISVGSLVNKTINGTTVKKFNTNINNDYYVLFKDSALTTTNLTHLASDLLLQDAYFIGVGKTASKTSFETAITKNMYRGTTFINPTDLTTVMNNLSEYLIDTINERYSENVVFALSEEDKILYETSYNDYEKNPIYKEKFETLHDPSVFENPQGKQLFSDSTPTIYTKVGLYRPTYQAMDNPLVNYSATKANQFESYRKWSNLAGDTKIYIHRMPIADFKVNINQSTGSFTITNAAYDLDKESINIGYGKGIAEQSFSWRTKGELVWKDGLPTGTLSNGNSYEVMNKVTDYQFQTTYLIKEVSLQKLPPVAVFDTDKKEYAVKEKISITNHSYDPNGDDLSAKWYWKVAGASNSTYKEFASGGTLKNGVANTNWNPSLTLDAVGVYDLKLVVTDTGGLTDQTVQQVNVVEPPIRIGFNKIQIYTDKADKGLPVTLSVDLQINDPEAISEKLTLSLLEKDSNKKVYSKELSIEQLRNGVSFTIPSSNLRKNHKENYVALFENFDDKMIEVLADSSSINTDGYTSSETILSKDMNNPLEDLSYKGVVMTERTIGKEMVKYYETLTIKNEKLGRSKTGYGREMNQDVIYSNDLKNMNYKIGSKVFVSSELIDSYLSYPIKDNEAVIELVSKSKTTSSDGKTLTQKLALPKVHVERKTGALFSETQKVNHDSRIQYELLDGGNKLYIPIWLDTLGEYNVRYESIEPIGANKVTFKVNDNLDIFAYMYASIGSDTIEDDEILIEPVNLHNPFPNGLPDGWTNADKDWLQN
jgi:hypothetical protein